MHLHSYTYLPDDGATPAYTIFGMHAKKWRSDGIRLTSLPTFRILRCGTAPEVLDDEPADGNEGRGTATRESC